MYYILIIMLFVGVQSCNSEGTKMKTKELNAEERRVILNKGTEMPYTGEFYDHWEEGTYVCRQCGAELYKSSSKFSAHCGWPSFDDEIKGAVKRVPDADGYRTEIVCANCDGHLGHVFLGEGFTDKDTRHCVNSISLDFVPKKKEAAMESKIEKAIFAGGCFWGVEFYFKKIEGVKSTSVGYIGGKVKNPTYKQVCYENTGHAEALLIEFDNSIVSFERLCRLFFEIHDPTQLNRQGPDVGDQYRSEIFYLNDEQKEVSEKLIIELKSKGFEVVTKITPATEFYEAEDYHQDYYGKTGKRPYCHFYEKRF